jgi:hypothetical protein
MMINGKIDPVHIHPDLQRAGGMLGRIIDEIIERVLHKRIGPYQPPVARRIFYGQ